MFCKKLTPRRYLEVLGSIHLLLRVRVKKIFTLGVRVTFSKLSGQSSIFSSHRARKTKFQKHETMKVLLNKFFIAERNLFYKTFKKSHLSNILFHKFLSAMKNLFNKTFIVWCFEIWFTRHGEKKRYYSGLTILKKLPLHRV